MGGIVWCSQLPYLLEYKGQHCFNLDLSSVLRVLWTERFVVLRIVWRVEVCPSPFPAKCHNFFVYSDWGFEEALPVRGAYALGKFM